MKLLFIAVCLVAACSAFRNDYLRVKLNHGGGVLGKYMTTNKGRGIAAFTGIPYAEAPVGNFRFADPVQKKGWTGFYNGQFLENVVCPQYNTWNNNNQDNVFIGQEDCLYMNVYVPMNVRNNKYEMKNLPVMFYLHGGGFTMGNGNQQFAGPDYLLDNDVILVTGNYRLGAFGFFTTDSEQFSGNYGLKDQVVMLKWIQDNIQHFGGDRNKVTIFGDGAGAASIGFHMMSQQSKGLFHQAILQGGTQFNQWALQDKQVAVRNAQKLMGLLGCDWNGQNSNNNFQQLQHCLRNKNTHDIVRATQQIYDWHNDPMVTFGPVIEGNNGQNFLTQDVYNNQKNYWGNSIPCVVGFNQNAGAFKWITIFNDKNLYQDVQNNFDKVMPHMFYYNHLDQQNQQKINNMLRDFYFKGKDFNNHNDVQQGFINMVTDGWFLSGIDQFLFNRLQFNKNGQNTFVFVFNYRGEGSYTDYMLQRMHNTDFTHDYHNMNNMGFNDNDYNQKYNFGVSNNDNQLYTFPFTRNVMNHRVMSHNDDQMKDLLTRMYFNFATNGNPSFDDQQYKWNHFNKYPVDYFRFGNFNKDTWASQKNNFGQGNQQFNSGMQNGLFDDRVNFWRQINQIRYQNNQNYNQFMKNEL